MVALRSLIDGAILRERSLTVAAISCIAAPPACYAIATADAGCDLLYMLP